MADETVTDEELGGLLARTEEAASALLQGDLREYLRLLPHTDDYTLLPPTGGPPRRGHDSSDAAVEATAQFFRGGEVTLEVVETYASGDLAVLVAIERQRGNVGGLPEQDWSLRITLVFRREESEWRLAHRHADALVHEIDMEQLAALARG